MKSRYLLIALMVLFGCKTPSSSAHYRLLMDSPALIWEESFPLGNGHLGMMPDGGLEVETIVLNDITLWSGAPSDDSNPLALESLPEIQRLLLEGRNDEAQYLMYETFVCGGQGSGHGQGAKVPFGCYQTLGNMILEYQYPNADSVTGYQRVLCLNDAIHKVLFDKGGQHYERDAFLSRADDVAVLRLTGPISFAIMLSREEKAKVFTEGGGLVLCGQMDSNVETVEGMKYYAKAQIVSNDGEVVCNDSTLQVENAGEAYVFFCSATDFMCSDPKEYVNEHLEAAVKKGYQKVLSDHLDSFRELFNRVDFQIEAEEESSRLTLDEHKARFLNQDDPWLATCYFQYGRYLLISSTREDLLPPNLQGLWANTIQTPWNGDYHLNINVEMNHWPCEVCNLSELHRPLIRFTEGLLPSGRKTARDFYGARGWTAHVVSNPWGFTAPGEHPSWGATNTGGAWLSLHAWQHFEFTQDTGFLKEVYPMMREAALFFLDAMIVEPENGWLVTAPTTSPENAFYHNGTTPVSVCMGSTMDVQIVSELYEAVCRAADFLDIDGAFADSLREAKSHFPPMQVSDEGYLMEWLKDYEEVDMHHRHVSHLFGLYPGTLLTFTHTGSIMDACRETLVRRGDGGTGWSRAWKICFWARLHDGDHAYRLLKNLLQPAIDSMGRHQAGTYPNLLCSHPPFQIDGNLGAAAGIAEMLMQSHDGCIHLLPALPALWPDGSFKGLCARGGAVVDCAWRDGKVRQVVISSRRGGTYSILCNGTERNVMMGAGETKRLRF